MNTPLCSICNLSCVLDLDTANWLCDEHGYERLATDEELEQAEGGEPRR